VTYEPVCRSLTSLARATSASRRVANPPCHFWRRCPSASRPMSTTTYQSLGGRGTRTISGSRAGLAPRTGLASRRHDRDAQRRGARSSMEGHRSGRRAALRPPGGCLRRLRRPEFDTEESPGARHRPRSPDRRAAPRALRRAAARACSMGLGLLRAGSRGGQGERPADPPGQLQPGVPAAGQERGPPPNPAARPPPYARDARSQGRRTPEGEQRAPGTRVAHVHTEAVRARDPRDAGEAASQIASLVSGAAGSSASFRT